MTYDYDVVWSYSLLYYLDYSKTENAKTRRFLLLMLLNKVMNQVSSQSGKPNMELSADKDNSHTQAMHEFGGKVQKFKICDDNQSISALTVH